MRDDVSFVAGSCWRLWCGGIYSTADVAWRHALQGALQPKPPVCQRRDRLRNRSSSSTSCESPFSLAPGNHGLIFPRGFFFCCGIFFVFFLRYEKSTTSYSLGWATSKPSAASTTRLRSSSRGRPYNPSPHRTERIRQRISSPTGC